jgi:hypothetical protein
MGTRHLIAVFADGEYKVAQYGQWDGYPDGQGVDVLEFLKTANLTQFLEKVRKSRFITKEEHELLWETAGAKPGAKFVGMDVSDKFKKANPQLDRDMGADVLAYIQQQPDEIALKDSISFAGESLFCEWAYAIDFDKGTFEAFKGFNKTPLDKTERFYDFKGSDEYQPVKLAASWPLDDLPDKDAFLSMLNPKSEDE